MTATPRHDPRIIPVCLPELDLVGRPLGAIVEEGMLNRFDSEEGVTVMVVMERLLEELIALLELEKFAE